MTTRTEKSLAVVGAYVAGASHMEIRKRFHVSSETLAKILNEFGVPPRIKKLAECEELEIVAEYVSSGGQSRALAKKFGISPRTVYKLLQKHGQEKLHYRCDDYQTVAPKAIEMYGNGRGISQTKIMELLKISPSFLWKIFKEAGVETFHCRTKFFDFDVFDRMSPEVAYHAGFGYADGCTSGNYYTIAIQERDVDVLQDFCATVGADPAFIKTLDLHSKNPNHSNQVCMNLCHKNLPLSLAKWGVIKNKTYNYSDVEIADELLPHYLRGWIDGDGCIYAPEYLDQGKWCMTLSCYHQEKLRFFKTSLERLGFSRHIGIYVYEDKNLLKVAGKKSVTELSRVLKAEDGFCMQRKWGKILVGQ